MTAMLQPARVFLLIIALPAALIAAEPRLDPLYPPNPALIGFLGVPGAGAYLEGGGAVWHRSGQIFALEHHSQGLHPLSIWKADPKTFRAARTATLQVGEAWCVSQKGDLLCAQSPRKDDEADLDPAVNGLAWQAGAFGCFSLTEGSRLWKLPVHRGETIIGAAFTLDDKMVAVLSLWGGQMSLRLLDAASGVQMRQHDFPGRAAPLRFLTTRLMMRTEEVWLQHREGETTMLLRFPLATLKPARVECPPLDGFVGGVRVSPDGRHILCIGSGEVTCLGMRGGKWQSVYEDRDMISVLDVESAGMPLRDAEFTPDGRLLVIITEGDVRITDLATRKTHRIRLALNSGGTLSPDGRHLLVEHEHGLEIISLRESDATDPARNRQNVWRPHLLRFSADGKTLFAADCDGVWVWDMASRLPKAWLMGFERRKPEGATFEALSLISNEREIVAAEHDDFLRWSLPLPVSPPSAVPQIIPPQLAFGGVRAGQSGAYSGVFVSADSKWVVTSNGERETVIHSGFGAGVSRTVLGRAQTVSPHDWFFGRDDSFVFKYVMNDAWHRLDLQQGTVAQLPSTRFTVLAVLPGRGFIINEGTGSFWAASLDGKTKLPNFEMPGRGFSRWLGSRAGVSMDEKRCALMLVDNIRRQQHVFVWEIETGKLLGQTLLPGNDCSSLALSPDGSVLACGHENTAISLWEVAKLAGLSASSPPTRVAAQPLQPRVPAPGSPPASPTVRQEHPFGSGLWDILENGTVTKGDALPEAGSLRVDGNVFTPRAVRLTSPYDLNRFQKAQRDFANESRLKPGNASFRPINHREYSAVAAGLIQISEGEAGEVWVSRQIGNPGGTRGACLTFTDAMTHRGSQEKQIVTEFEVHFPALTKALVDSSFKPVQMEADGSLKLAPDAVWIAALPEAGKSVTVPVFMFRSASGGVASRLLWKAETSTLTVRHPLTLVPGETRWMMHALRVITLKNGESPAQFAMPAVTDHGLVTAPTVSKNAINFGPPAELEPPVFGRLRNVRRRPDEFGASWIEDVDRSLVNDTTTSKAHQLWLDGAPLPFSSKGAFLLLDTMRQEIPPGGGGHVWVDGSNLDRSIIVTRSTEFQDRSLPLIIDHFINQTDQPVKSKPVYVSTFTETVRTLYDASGRPVEVGATPVKASTLGGSLILEFAGTDRPSTALMFYQDGAPAEPNISRPSPKMVKIEYEVTLPPKKNATFWHGATQRNLASFDSVTEAFTGALPFKRSPTDSSEGYMNVK